MMLVNEKEMIKILGYRFRVDNEKTHAEIGAFGRCHSKDNVIQIASDLSEDQTLSTMLHEIIEALSFVLRYDLSEDQVLRLEAGLYTALTDNGVDLKPLLTRARAEIE